MIIKTLKRLRMLVNLNVNKNNEDNMLAIGRLLSNQQNQLSFKEINNYEFKIFSQFGDDGLIQYLIKNVRIKNTTFIEFGVEDFLESNTRFLMMNNNWTGFVMDGSEEAMLKLKTQNWFWRYELNCRAVFIDKKNINQLLKESGLFDIGILHIDLDGNDFHILEALDLTKINPAILITEYNSVFGKERAITVPYNMSFYRTDAHYSNLYWGASLKALNYAAERKGYSLVTCNTAGNNAYFVRNDLLSSNINKTNVENAYVESKYRESRDKKGQLSFISGKGRIEQIRGLDVYNVETQHLEKI